MCNVEDKSTRITIN